MRAAFLVFVLAAVNLPALAQPKWGTPQDPQRAPAAPSSGKKLWGAPANADPRAERCANLRRELSHARREEREARSTTSADQAATRRQRIAEARQKAGC